MEYISSWSLNLILWPLGGSRCKLSILTPNQLLSCYGEQTNSSLRTQIWSNIFIRSLWSPDECCQTLNRSQCLFTATSRTKKKTPVSRSSHTVSFCGAFFSLGAVCSGWCESCQTNPGVDQTTRRGKRKKLPRQTLGGFVCNVQTNEPTTRLLVM